MTLVMDPVFKASSPLPGRSRPAPLDDFGGLTLDDLIEVYAQALDPLPQAYGYARRIGHMAAEDLNAAVKDPNTPGGEPFKFFVTGSVGKRTALAPIRSVDVVLVLDDRLNLTKAKDALTLVHTLADASHKGHVIIRTDQAIEIFVPPMTVRVLPAIAKRQGFLIPGPVTLTHSSGWRLTNPVAESATFRLADRTYGGRPRKLLHLMKAWKAVSDANLSGFALEILAGRYFAERANPGGWLQTLQDFTVWMRACTPDEFDLPGNRIPMFIDSQWHPKAQAAYWRCILAKSMERERDLVKAALEMRGMLGKAFPVPGDDVKEHLPLFKADRSAAA